MGRLVEHLLSFLNSPHSSCNTQVTIPLVRVTNGNRDGVRRVTITVMILALICISLSAGTLWAATITAASCSRNDVGDAVESALDGDTVLIPAGNCTWTTNLTINNKRLILQGAGINQTVIIDGVSKALFPNIPQMLVWVTKPGGLTRLTGMTFQGGTIADNYNKGMVIIRGTSHQLRVDHCKFVPTQTAALMFFDYVWGVTDHNLFDLSAAHGYAVYAHHNTWSDPSSNYGDASWADSDSFGTERALFFEDNTFYNSQSNYWFYYAADGWMGGRVVYRYNKFQATVMGNHGTESGGRQRGQRQFEVYNNTFTWDLSIGPSHGGAFPDVIGARSGVGVVFNNAATITNGTVNTVFDVTKFRADQPYAPWGQCGTSSVWDGNTNQYGYPCIDQLGTGKSDLLSGVTPSPQGYPHNTGAPTYAWNNTINGVQKTIISNRPNYLVANRDFFDKIKPGYTPYIYPHPLLSGSSATDASPAAPTNLSVN
jgi:hypothetical protein